MSRFGKGEGVARVVCVHGVGQQRETETTLHRGWAPALCGGVQLAGDRLGEHEVRCAAYGDLFRLPGRALAVGDPLQRAENLDKFERDLLELWWAEAARTDPNVVAPDARTLARAPRGSQAALRALSGSRFFAALGERALLGDLRQVRDYLHKPEVRREARKRVAKAVEDNTRSAPRAFVGVGGGLRGVECEPRLANPDAGHARLTAGDPELNLRPCRAEAPVGDGRRVGSSGSLASGRLRLEQHSRRG